MVSQLQGRTVKAGNGKILKTTAVFDTYWRFAAARQDIFMSRIADVQGPMGEAKAGATSTNRSLNRFAVITSTTGKATRFLTSAFLIVVRTQALAARSLSMGTCYQTPSLAT